MELLAQQAEVAIAAALTLRHQSLQARGEHMLADTFDSSIVRVTGSAVLGEGWMTATPLNGHCMECRYAQLPHSPITYQQRCYSIFSRFKDYLRCQTHFQQINMVVKG